MITHTFTLLQLVESWTVHCKELEIPVSDELTLVSVLGDPYEIRQWNINGLPRDSVSCAINYLCVSLFLIVLHRKCFTDN